MNIFAKISGIKYEPFLCANLQVYNFEDLDVALQKEGVFILKIDEHNKLALSWWVSAKRTRSYPYARVYDSLKFSGRKVTIIPIFKDEGKEGDRDFLQWDTISLMSLLDVYVIIAYYIDASPSSKYKSKITDQKFYTGYIKKQIRKLLDYKSSALHWNIQQIDGIWEVGKKALESYEKISKSSSVEMHSTTSAEKRVIELEKGKESFMAFSRGLAQKAQLRESMTLQPKEKVDGTKATITIKNYLGGYYYFTVDEIKIDEDKVSLVDAKNTNKNKLPSLSDIKDGLLKMTLFTNLEDVTIGGKAYKPEPILKLTTGNGFEKKPQSGKQIEVLENLKREAKINGFRIQLNERYLV